VQYIFFAAFGKSDFECLTHSSTNVDLFSLAIQGCQMVYFKTKKSQFGYFVEGLGMENVVYILRPFGVIYGRLVEFVFIWYIFPFWTKKTGNPAAIHPDC
jgi:hypothetical protein